MSLISHVNRIKADSAEALNKAEAELSLAEQRYVADPALTKANTLQLQTRVVNQLQFEKAR